MVFLLGFAQVDDLIFVGGATPSDPVPSDDDEYLPAEREGAKEDSQTRQGINFGEFFSTVGVTNNALIQGCTFPESRRSLTSEGSSLYVFMSLRR
jgi:hypothetical protein